MSFFTKLTQFRDNPDTTLDQQQKESPFRPYSQTEDDQNQSIRDLWQQAVDIHKEKLSASKELDGEHSELTMNDEGPLVVEQQAQEKVEGKVEEEQVPDLLLVPPIEKETEPVVPEHVLTEPVISKSGSQVEKADLEESVSSLAHVTLDELNAQVDHILQTVYGEYRKQTKNFLGKDPLSISLQELKDTPLGQDLKLIVEVYINQGRITHQALLAVNRVLETLWKSFGDQDYRVPEGWYQSPIGYVCRYIMAGQSTPIFDPVDLSTAASMLGQTERSIIENYPRLGGVKLAGGYVFSRHKILEYHHSNLASVSPVTFEMLEHYYSNSKVVMKKLMKIRSFMIEAYDQIRYLRELLLQHIDFNENRMRQAVKEQTERRLSDLYQSFLELKSYRIDEIQINKNDFLAYSIPNVFSEMDRLEGGTISGDAFIRSLEETVKIMDEEKAKVNSLINEMAKNLGYLNMELEQG
ncbi:hypothetical protein [Ammoniphilus sp. CFH 90114]|uniref:hypothetical protein n=1 Tax=Ammoniphilus sp. CFH 90114 TaxID=2493665 RepID=UPI00100F025E|nr:hypothetical protein [Ammoniphilus sp. CFH 90114]RXT15241.1 hypothetical protein EIZ39_03250 [Ammoniphilus sp. CFH 90114]